jgi:hypothetical protein
MQFACEESHERARRDSDAFALFHQIGSMPTEDDDGKPIKLLLANCPTCHSTIAKESR